MPTWDDLPIDIIRLIYEFDSSFYDKFKDEIKLDLEIYGMEHWVNLNRGYTINNFKTIVFPDRILRYYDRTSDTIQGSYARGWCDCKEPL